MSAGAPQAGAALALDGVTVALGGRTVVSDVTATLEPGRLVALLGPNGAGKTTLLRAVAGLVRAGGRARLGGRDLLALRPAERARLVALLPQGHQAHWPLSARDVAALGRHPHGARDPSRLSAADEARVTEAMRRAGCLALAERDVQTLSGGERARVMMARVLAVGAPLLLADEPTASLDPRHAIAVMEALREEAARGALVVAVTHDVALAARFADAVLVMHEGRLVANGAPDAVLGEALMAGTYGVTIRRVAVEGRTLVLPWGLA